MSSFMSRAQNISNALQKHSKAHTALIDGLGGEQGGAVLNVAKEGEPPLESHIVYTGYGGSQVLPFVTIEMNSFTKVQEPLLKKNPPPFDDSMQRPNHFLKSVRLRPTNVPMPELVK